MSIFLKLKITLLNSQHDRNKFDCGEIALNNYLKKFSRQNDEKNMSRTFVATMIDDAQTIMGFYTLSTGSILFDSLPEKMNKLPKYPIPIIRIGRLAVDQNAQGQAIGSYLLMDALYRCACHSEEIGIFGVVVDAKNEKSKNFYTKYGFETLTNSPLTLIIPIRDVILAMTNKTMMKHIFV